MSHQWYVPLRYPLFALALILGLLALHSQYRLQASSIAEQHVQTITITNTGFLPGRLNYQQGDQVSLAIVNRDTRPHNFVLEGCQVQSPTLKPNESTSLQFTASQRGTFLFVSNSPGDTEAGYRGVVVVE
jgi:uncharacterized cupredoxin-like copper-binding protein